MEGEAEEAGAKTDEKIRVLLVVENETDRSERWKGVNLKSELWEKGGRKIPLSCIEEEPESCESEGIYPGVQ